MNGTTPKEASTKSDAKTYYVRVQLRSKEGVVVANQTSNSDLKGILEVEKAMPWWPYLMHTNPGYLYEMEIFLHSPEDVLLDVYRMKVGIRTLTWNNTSFFINGKPIYFRGFGRHEDSDVSTLIVKYLFENH